MSKVHHNEAWYVYWRIRQPMCLLCGKRKGAQFHHFQIVGADRYAGPAPRRASTYNAYLVCDTCHDEIHDVIGEAEVIERHLGSKDELYRIAMRHMHEFADWMQAIINTSPGKPLT